MNKVSRLILMALAIFLVSPSFADGDNDATNNSGAKASISGRVADNRTGEMLVGVLVAIEGTDLKVYTDLDGSFTFNSINPGNYNLVLSLISYKNSLVENLKLDINKKKVIDIKLDGIR